MSVDIKTATIEPVRQTFSNVARRLGADKPASRYQEATFDIQSECNFHYRPLWDAEREVYDKRRTAIVMQDWYAFKDPRQFYYGSYVTNRSKMQDGTEKKLEFVEKHDALAGTPNRDDVEHAIRSVLLPLRHVEYAANLNNCFISAYGWGAAICNAATFAMIDRLGIAQHLSRIGLLTDGNTGESLKAAKRNWMENPQWQPLRKLVEDNLVKQDWFELFIAQNLVQDGLLYPFVYGSYVKDLSRKGSAIVALLTEFIEDWYTEHVRWVDSFVKTAATESAANQQLLSRWATTAMESTTAALEPLAVLMRVEHAQPALDEAIAGMRARLMRAGLSV
jgi:phenol/toluene 2-monooxygenase (NADH) P1/A1